MTEKLTISFPPTQDQHAKCMGVYEEATAVCRAVGAKSLPHAIEEIDRLVLRSAFLRSEIDRLNEILARPDKGVTVYV